MLRASILAFVIFSRCCYAQSAGVSPPDPFVLKEFPVAVSGQIVTGPGTNTNIRNQTIDPAKKTLILICAGQSNLQDITPTLYTPTNSSVVDNFNIYDGASYSVAGPLLGTYWTSNVSPQGPGNSCARVADSEIPTFDRVIMVPVAVGSTMVSDWSTGVLATRLPVAMRRLASRGITPSVTGTTFAMIWWQGESDCQNGTSQISYQGSFGTVVSNLQAAGFIGRIFINKESWIGGTTCSAVTSAQGALVDSVTIFAGGNLDTLTAGSRLSDNTHFNDAGAASAASLVVTAMHASGAPF